MAIGCTRCCVACTGPEISNYGPPIQDFYPNFLAPKTIPESPWSYCGNLETIARPVPEL